MYIEMPLPPTIKDIQEIMFEHIKTIKKPIYKTALIKETQIKANKVLYETYYQRFWIPNPYKTKILKLARIVFDSFVKDGIIKYSPQQPIEMCIYNQFPTLKDGY